MSPRLPLLVPLVAMAAACAAVPQVTPVPSGPPRGETRPRLRPPTHLAPPAPRPQAQVQTLPGLEGVIGSDADQLTRLFGKPRLDIREEDARKLQWTGGACILDAYLYPTSPGGRATATYVDARRSDGRDVDRAACVAALKLGAGGATRP